MYLRDRPISHVSYGFESHNECSVRITAPILQAGDRSVAIRIRTLGNNGGEANIAEQGVNGSSNTVRVVITRIISKRTPLRCLVDGAGFKHEPALGADSVPGGVVEHHLRVLLAVRTKVSVDADSITNVIPGGLFHSSPPCHIEWVAVNSDGDIWSFLLSCCPESLVTICRRHSLRRRPNCTPDYISLLLKCLFTSGLIRIEFITNLLSSWPILRIKSQKPFQQTEGQRISVRKFLSKRHRLLLSHTSEKVRQSYILGKWYPLKVSQEDQSSNPADEQHFFQGIGAFQLKPQQRYSRCSIYQ
nr:hypothetical protein LR48_Vigan11g031400 [Ipomoea batatas]